MGRDGVVRRTTLRGLCWGAALAGAAGLLLAVLILLEGGIGGSPLARAGMVAWISVLAAAAGLVVGAPAGLAMGLCMRAIGADRGAAGVAIEFGLVSVAVGAAVLLWVLGWGPFGIPYAAVATLVAAVPVVRTVRAERRRATSPPVPVSRSRRTARP